MSEVASRRDEARNLPVRKVSVFRVLELACLRICFSTCSASAVTATLCFERYTFNSLLPDVRTCFLSLSFAGSIGPLNDNDAVASRKRKGLKADRQKRSRMARFSV